MSWNWKNNMSTNGIPYSRYIASWTKVNNGKLYRKEFIDWLVNFEHLPLDEAEDIYEMASNGKMELEDSARRFLKKEFIRDVANNEAVIQDRINVYHL